MTSLEYYVRIMTGRRALPVLIWEYKVRKMREAERAKATAFNGTPDVVYGGT